MPISQAPGQASERLRAEYHETVRANAAAKRRHDEVTSQTFTAPKTFKDGFTAEELLDQRLELLEQQDHHARLTVLKDQLFAMKVPAVFATVKINSGLAENLKDANTAEDGLEQLTASMSRSVEALELALVQAHQEARREKSMLDSLKASAVDQALEVAERRPYAMMAVQKELTAWLEQNLDQCLEESSVLEAEGEEARNDDRDWDLQIDHQYEQYLAARRRLLSAAARLKTPLPTEDPMATNGEKVSEEARYKSPPNSITADFERMLLPAIHQERLWQAYSTLATEQLGKDITTTTNLLDRLSDESQLLQAFPLLDRSGRFEKARSTFGSKPQISGREVKDEVTKRLEPWIFAAEAADIASTDTTEKHLQQANEAMDIVSRSLVELQLLQET